MIRARVARGFVTSDPWAPAIDGILAYAAKMLEHGDPETFALSAARTSELRPVEGLPLMTVRHGDLWWYAASCPIADVKAKERTYFNRRFDAFHAAESVPSAKRVMTAAGPYKSTRTQEVRYVCSHVDWHCIGDPDACMNLLRVLPSPSIGAGRARGHGEVIEWQLLPPSDDTESIALFHRQLPVDYAREKGVDGPVMMAPFRPPARIRENNTLCVMPPPIGERIVRARDREGHLAAA